MISRAVVAALIAGSTALSGATFTTNFRADTEQFARHQSRITGSAGTESTRNELLDRLKALPNVKTHTHRFPVVVPETDSASLTVAEGAWQGTHRIYPLWPAGARQNTTPKNGLSGRLIYVGTAELDELPAKSLTGNLAVMEFNCGENWKNAVSLGAAGILFLGSDKVKTGDIISNLTVIPVNVPRFYVPDGQLADALRKSEIPTGTLFASGHWQEKTAVNIYSLIRPAKPVPGQKALVYYVPYDAGGIVPAFASGADAAVDVSFLINLTEEWAARPPVRPVIVCFADAYAVSQLGTRRMLEALAVTTDQREKYTRKDLKQFKEYKEHRELAREIPSGKDGIEKISGDKYRDLYPYIKDEVAREVVQVENILQPLRLRLYREKGKAGEQEIRRRIRKLDAQRMKFARAQRLMLKQDPVADKDLPLTLTLWKRALTRIESQYASLAGYLDAVKKTDAIRLDFAKELGITGDDPVPVSFITGIDLSDAAETVGPLLWDRYYSIGEDGPGRDLKRWLKNTCDAERDRLFPGRYGRVFNTHPLRGTDSGDSYTYGNLASLTSSCASFGVGGLTLTTLEGLRTRVDSPRDLPELLNWNRLTPQTEVLRTMLNRMVYKNDFSPTYHPTPGWQRLEGKIVDQAPGDPVPRLPMPDYLVTMVGGEFSGTKEVTMTVRPSFPGVRKLEFVKTGVDGWYRMAPAVRHGLNTTMVKQVIQAYDFAPDGSIVRAVDFNKSGKGVRLSQNLTSFKYYPLRAVMFNCHEMQVVGLHDPRLLFNLPNSQIIDMSRGNKPQRLHKLQYLDMIAFHLEPDIVWQMVLRAGATQNRMLLLNMMPPDKSAGIPAADAMYGFKIGDPMPGHPTVIAARDIYWLNQRRLDEYRKAGIKSEAINQLRQRTGLLLGDAAEAIKNDDGARMYSAASGALANEVRAYQSIRDMANDVIRAAIFLLLMLIPFAFVMERLLIATPFIYKQLGGIFAIFATMTAILWSFHPAFRISSQPLMIIMAFGIIFLSLMVISVVYGKFESGVEELRSGRAESTAARTSRTGVLTSAFKLGVANMRKRKVRTALTGLTIVLITFALLCFTSASTYTSRRESAVEAKAPYTGVLLKQPTNWSLPTAAIKYMQTMAGEADALSLRYWTINPHNAQGMIHVGNPVTGKIGSFPTVLSISTDEGKLTGLDKILPDYGKFGPGGCYISTESAVDLKVKAGDKVTYEGRELTIIGLFDAKTLTARAMDLDGRSMLPMDYSAMDDNERKLMIKNDVANMLSQAETGGGSGKEFPVVRGSSVFINHSDTRTDLSGIRSIAVGTKDGASAKKLANELAKRLAFPIYYGTENGSFVLSATPLVPMAPKSLFIPLLIACLIIFNTMLSSVSERKREIHIYTSLGLAPLHIGVLFLAEAVTYGLMGSIFGYIVGQGVATVFAKLGFMGGITLNYSGTQAIATMLLVLGVVILSSLVPAWMAGKMAVPSTDRTWQVPRPVDDVITDTLPFTFTGQTAGGLMVFLYEYLDAHREGSIGHFSTGDIEYGKTDVDGHPFLTLQSVVWLAPYDLGVRQNIHLSIRETDENDVFELDIAISRGAGQTKTWWKLNKTYISDLRKQLLGWRKLKSWRIMEYVEMAEAEIKKLG